MAEFNANVLKFVLSVRRKEDTLEGRRYKNLSRYTLFDYLVFC